MDVNRAARCLGGLGHPVRLTLFQTLAGQGTVGATVGMLQRAVDVPLSTLNHHLARLTQVGLITQERRGRTVLCRANLALMRELLAYLQEHAGTAAAASWPAVPDLDSLHRLVRRAVSPKPASFNTGGTMFPHTFDYAAPGSLDEAVGLLRQHGEDAKILSGGHSLLPLMKLRLAVPSHIVDINGIAGLSYVREAGDHLLIGGLTRESELEDADVIRQKYPLIFETANSIADPQVRNRATVGGNLAHGDPANDHPATMLALGAEMVVVGAGGERVVPVDEFFVDMLTTALQPDEILKEIRVPKPPERSGGAYIKLERRVGDFAIVAVAAQVTVDGSGNCAAAGIGLTNAAPTPLKATAAEAALRGQRLDARSIGEAARLAAEAADPADDTRAPAEYKRAMVAELTRRALTRAMERATGGN